MSNIKEIQQQYDTAMDSIKSQLSEKYLEIKELMKQGYTKVEIAAHLDWPVSRLKKYRKLIPELDSALELGETHCMAWWTKQGRSGLFKKEFNFNLWNIFMKNNFGYGDRPSERTADIESWQGSFSEKITAMDEKMRSGEISAEMYSHMMKSLSYHANVNEICYVTPMLERLEIDQQLKNGDITADEHRLMSEYLDVMDSMRTVSAEMIMDENKVRYSERIKKVKAIKSTMTRVKADRDALENSELVEEPTEREKAFIEKAQRLKELKSNKLKKNRQYLAVSNHV